MHTSSLLQKKMQFQKAMFMITATMYIVQSSLQTTAGRTFFNPKLFSECCHGTYNLDSFVMHLVQKLLETCFESECIEGRFSVQQSHGLSFVVSCQKV